MFGTNPKIVDEPPPAPRSDAELAAALRAATDEVISAANELRKRGWQVSVSIFGGHATEHSADVSVDRRLSLRH